jgi:hypothetical protein
MLSNSTNLFSKLPRKKLKSPLVLERNFFNGKILTGYSQKDGV